MKTDPRLWARAVPLTRGARSPAEAMTGRAAGPRESALHDPDPRSTPVSGREPRPRRTGESGI